MQAESVDEMVANVDAANQQKSLSRRVADYCICETLGSGAFGTVYKVRKQSGQSYFAMKEVSTCARLGPSFAWGPSLPRLSWGRDAHHGVIVSSSSSGSPSVTTTTFLSSLTVGVGRR